MVNLKNTLRGSREKGLVKHFQRGSKVDFHIIFHVLIEQNNLHKVNKNQTSKTSRNLKSIVRVKKISVKGHITL